jgi:hypothetical protein
MRKRESAANSLHKPLQTLLLHKTANLGLHWIRSNLRECADTLTAPCDASTLTLRLQKGAVKRNSEKQSIQ